MSEIKKPITGKKGSGRTKAPKLPVVKNSNTPQCPSYLDATAKAEWHLITSAMVELGVLDQIDRTLLEVYCQTYSRYRKALLQVEEEGEVIIAANGYQQQNNWLIIAERTGKEIRLCLKEMGVTPSAREKMTLKQGGDASRKWEGKVIQ